MSGHTDEEIIRSIGWMSGWGEINWDEVDWRDLPNVHIFGDHQQSGERIGATFRLIEWEIQ
jgi:hypothetical protein